MVFGKKKKKPMVEPATPQDLRIPPQQPQIPQQPQPTYQQPPPYIPQQQTPRPPVPQPPIEVQTPFCIAERAMVQTPETMIAPESGQFVSTGQMQMREQIRILHNLSLEDLIQIVANTQETIPIHVKVKSLLKRMMK